LNRIISVQQWEPCLYTGGKIEYFSSAAFFSEHIQQLAFSAFVVFTACHAPTLQDAVYFVSGLISLESEITLTANKYNSMNDQIMFVSEN
jgi:hypothetical protein